MKGEQLHDVIGRSYEIEVRVSQNKKANADRARCIAAGKIAEAAEKAKDDTTGTKRLHDRDDTDESAEDIYAAQKPRKRQRSKDSTQPRSETLTSATAATEASLSAGDFTHPPGHRLNTPQSLALQNISSWPTSAGVSSLDKVTGLVQASAYDNALPKRKSTKRGLIDRDELDRDIAPPLQKNKSKSRAIAFRKAVSTKVTTEPFAPVGSTDDKVNKSGHTRKLRPRRNVKAPGAEAATDSSTF